MTIQLSDQVLRLAKNTAKRTERNHRGFVEAHDVFQELYLWMVAHPSKVKEWDAEWEDGGRSKLAVTLRREAQRFALRERAAATRVPASEFFLYPVGLIEELLEQVWDRESWTSTSRPEDVSGVRHPSRPSEGHNRLVMLIDVDRCFKALSDEDRKILALRFFFGGMHYTDVGRQLGIEPTTARKRVSRALHRLQDLLGGEPVRVPERPARPKGPVME